MTTLTNLKIFHEHGVIDRGTIQFDEQIITISNQTKEGIDLTGCIAIPGFIDQHIHGVKGFDVMDSTEEALASISKELVKEGTTSFFATTLTDTEENIILALQTIAHYQKNPAKGYAELLGIHLEGPFLSSKHSGAQEESLLLPANMDTMNRFLIASQGQMKHITIAPEIEGGYEMISYLKSKGIVVSVGHTDATYEQSVKALGSGANCFTHGFNAMRGFHHRQIGCVGAMLLEKDSYAEIIADGIHVSKDAIRLFHQLKQPNRRILVTDSMRAKCLVDGKYKLANLSVDVKDGIARLENGTLAGSTLRYVQGFQNYMEWTNAAIQEMILASSTNTARLHRISDSKGSLAISKDADIVIMNSKYEIVMVFCKGNLAYQKQ